MIQIRSLLFLDKAIYKIRLYISQKIDKIKFEVSEIQVCLLISIWCRSNTIIDTVKEIQQRNT